MCTGTEQVEPNSMWAGDIPPMEHFFQDTNLMLRPLRVASNYALVASIAGGAAIVSSFLVSGWLGSLVLLSGYLFLLSGAGAVYYSLPTFVEYYYLLAPNAFRPKFQPY